MERCDDGSVRRESIGLGSERQCPLACDDSGYDDEAVALEISAARGRVGRLNALETRHLMQQYL